MTKAKKSDWRTKRLPAKHTTIPLGRKFSPEEMDSIMEGFIPKEMEDKWFIFWDKEKLYFHRSWTGFCVYIAQFIKQDDVGTMVEALVNRNPKQYSETSDSKDAKLISWLIDILLLKKDSEYPSDDPLDKDDVLKMWSNAGRAILGQYPSGDSLPNQAL